MILQHVSKDVRSCFLLVLWRAWFLRNDILFGAGRASVEGSFLFLLSYWDSLRQDKQNCPKTLDLHGKASCCPQRSEPVKEDGVQFSNWRKPPVDWVKVNSDGAFVRSTGDASAGVVIRDHEGRVLLSSWKVIRNCGSAEEA